MKCCQKLLFLITYIKRSRECLVIRFLLQEEYVVWNIAFLF